MAIPADTKKLYIPLETISGAMDSNGNYTMRPLDLKNLNDNLWAIVKKIQGGITISDLTELTIKALTAVTVVTQNLYAVLGDVSELTTDRLLTANKVEKYWASDTNDINYIDIQGQYIKFMTGDTNGSTTQHTDRNGNLLYYNGAVTAETYQTVGMSTTVTAYPVTVYDYTTLTKMELSFTLTGGVYEVDWWLGAGTGTGNNGKAHIHKDTTGVNISYYHGSTGAERTVRLDNDGIRATGVDVCIVKNNESSVSATTSETIAVSKTITLDVDSRLVIWFSCEVTASTALNLTAKTYIGGVAQTYQPTLYCASAQKYVLTYCDFKESLDAGTTTVEVKLFTDTGTGSISASHANMIIQAYANIFVYPGWTTYPDSPVSKEDYPYQVIYDYLGNIRLVVSPQKIYAEVTPAFAIFPYATDNKMYQFNGSDWVLTYTNSVAYSFNELLQANNDIYTDNTFTTVYFSQTTP